MFLAKVIGNVVSTHKDPKLHGMKLLVVQPFDPQDNSTQTSLVAVDTIGAGNEEIVLVVRGSSARRNISNEAPVDAAIVGIVDSMEIENEVVQW